MGLFSRTPRIPDPVITIYLDDHCRGACFPGSNVSGTITLESPAQRTIETVLTSFFGHAMTATIRHEGTGNNRRTIYYEDDAGLFFIEQPTCQSATVEQDIIYSWPFQFQFPHSSGGLEGPSPYTGETATTGVYLSDSHPLPPSFGLRRSSHEYAIVEYKVQAHVKFSGEKDPFMADTEPLNFVPYNPRPQPSPFAEFVKEAQQYSSSRLIGEEKSFRHSFLDKFSSGTPSLNLVMKSTVSPRVTSSGSFPIYACIELDSFSDSKIDVPLVNIKIKSLKLCRYTFYRSLRVRSSFFRKEQQEIHEELVPLNTVPESLQVEGKYGDTNGRKFVYFPASFEARIPGDACPSFQTFNINHNFQLEFELEAEVCEKKFEYEVVVPNVIVFPSR